MIVLNMIVKNESNIIERCLDSLLEMIDAFVICDTGSTDNTIEVINNWKSKNNISGKILEHSWVNFEHNRNLALDCCKEWIFENSKENKNYICNIDADDYLVIQDPELFRSSCILNDSKMKIDIKFGDTIYDRTFIFPSYVKSKWEGALHEQLICESNITKLKGAHILVNTDGDRNKDPMKYLKDVLVLETALEKDPGNHRNLFYLAQSFRDFDYKIMAEKLYLERFEIPHNDQERYICLLEAGKCRIKRGKNDDKTLNILMKAFQFHPHRLEAPYYIIRYFISKGLYRMGYQFGKSLLNTPIPEGLFIDTSVYNWRFNEEVSICACWCNDKELFKKLSNDILKLNLQEKDKERISYNLTEYS